MELNLIWLDLILLLVFHHLYAYSSGDLKNKLYLQFKFSDGEKLLTINALKPRGRSSISIIADYLYVMLNLEIELGDPIFETF